MGIIHVRPKWGKQHGRKKSGSSACLRVERNRDGILYFRQPKGEDEIITWRIYPPGEAILSKGGVGDGMCLAPGMFKRLRDGGHLYTARGKPSTSTSKTKSTEQTGQSLAKQASGNARQQQPSKGATPSAKAQRKAEEAARRQTAMARIAERIKREKEEEQSRRGARSGRIFTVWKPAKELEADRAPRRNSTRQALQSALSWTFKMPVETKSKKSNDRDAKQAKRAPAGSNAGSSGAVSIHPGWTSRSAAAENEIPSGHSRARQEFSDESD